MSSGSEDVVDLTAIEEAVAPDDEKVLRKRRNRVKTGCITCRIRRVKCDEARPNCVRCTSTGRTCDGYLALPMSRRDLPVALDDRKSVLLSCHQIRGVTGFSDGTELLYFNFFREKTATLTNQFFSSEFWSKLVLQLSHDEPAVKHAVLAISALHQQWDLYGTSGYDVDKSAFVQYNKSVGEAREMVKRTQSGYSSRKEDIEKVLVTCILFICFESLIGDYARASLHLGNGLQILETEGMDLAARGPNQSLEWTIVELFNHFDFQAMTISQAQFPRREAATRFRTTPPAPLPARFESLAEVRTYLFEQVNWCLAVDEVLGISRMGIQQYPGKSPSEIFMEAAIANSKSTGNLKLFWEMVEDFVDRECIPSQPEFRVSPPYVYLRLYHRMASVINTAGSLGIEMAWDDYIPEFLATLDDLTTLQHLTTNERTTLSLEVGLCVPLFVIGNKCREPSIRRRAIAILDASRRKEGIWESTGAARVVERLMFMEERTARDIHATATGVKPADIKITSRADVPESARIQWSKFHINMPGRVVHMSCYFRTGSWDDPNAMWTVLSERVDI